MLWVPDNYISSLAGLSQVVSLQQLNLARNDITIVGRNLQHNSSLTSLNLSDNRISSLQVNTLLRGVLCVCVLCVCVVVLAKDCALHTARHARERLPVLA